MSKQTVDFPSDNLSPSDKLDPIKFGLPIAKAIHSKNLRNGGAFFINDRKRYGDIMDWLFANRRLESEFDPFLGIKPDKNNKTWMKAIDRQIKNYLTKRVNIALGKVLNRKYDLEVDNIDRMAIDAKDDITARLQLLIDHRSWFDKMQKEAGANTRPEGVEPGAALPINRDEIDLFVELDYKTAEEIGMELGMKHHLRRNRWTDIRAEQAFFAFAFGVQSVYVDMDENMLPLVESWEPGDLIVPRSRKPNFTELPYIAGIRNMTIPEFRKLAKGQMSDTDIEEAIKKFGRKSDTTAQTSQTADQQSLQYDDVDRMPMMLYNYRSTDEVVASVHEDQYTNKKLHYKTRQYYDGPEGEEDFKQKYGESRKLYRECYNTVYKGWWIVNSDYPPLHHGPRSSSIRKFGNLSEDLMGFKVFAPNAWNGNIVSTGEQMIPMAKELQRYYLKIQQLVSKMIPTVIGIDLYALSKANLKWDNKDLTDQDKIEMYMSQHIFVYSSKDRYAPGANYKPFHVEKQGTGDEIDKLLKLCQQSLFELDEVIGFTRPVAATTLAPGEGKATTEIQIEASDIALGYLYDSDFRMFEEVCESMGTLHVESVKRGPKEYYDRIFGKLKTGVTYSKVRFDKYDYGFHVKVRPSSKEWDALFLSAEKAYDKGVIKYSDILLLREMESLKQARRYLIMRERQFESKQMENSAILQQQNQATQSQSLQDKAAADIQVAEAEHNFRIAEEEFKRESLVYAHDMEMEKEMRKTLNQGTVDKGNIEAQGEEDRQLERIRAIVNIQVAKIGAEAAKKRAAKTPAKSS